MTMTMMMSIMMLASMAVTILWAASDCRGDELVTVGLQKQLLVDDYVVAQKQNVTREMGVATKHDSPVLIPDKPWEEEGSIGSYLTVLYDRSMNKFRMWYLANRTGIGYAESIDGINWTKPNVASDGQNNIVFTLSNHFSVSIDQHETDPQHRYKAAYMGPEVKATLAHSPDGINWTSYNGGNPVTGRAADTHNQIIWDPLAGIYRLYTRTDFGPWGGVNELRGVRCMTNPDVKADPTNWTVVREWKFDREGEAERWRRQIYALTNTIYENVHFGIMSVFEYPPKEGYESTVDHFTRHEENILNFYIGTSRDSDSWDLDWVYSDKPLISRGPDGSFDKDMIKPASQIVTWDDQHWLYYYGANERHGLQRQAAIGLSTLRLDGFICLEAIGDEWGQITTKPFILEGDTLQINVEAAEGALLVEVLDENDSPYVNRERKQEFDWGSNRIYECVDQLRFEPRWRGDRNLESLKGKVVKLRFHLRNAKLYAFQIQ